MTILDGIIGITVRLGLESVSGINWNACPTSSESTSSVILAAVTAQIGISLIELADLLWTEHGASFGASTVWRCLDRHGMSLIKTARRRSKAARRRSPAPGLVRRPV